MLMTGMKRKTFLAGGILVVLCCSLALPILLKEGRSPEKEVKALLPLYSQFSALCQKSQNGDLQEALQDALSLQDSLNEADQPNLMVMNLYQISTLYKKLGLASEERVFLEKLKQISTTSHTSQELKRAYTLLEKSLSSEGISLTDYLNERMKIVATGL